MKNITIKTLSKSVFHPLHFTIKALCILGLIHSQNVVNAGTVAYIHGDVAGDGSVPSGSHNPYDPMLITDTGKKGVSSFAAMVEAEGHSIEQFYDQDLTLTPDFLSSYDVIIFSLHQKIWSSAEKEALDDWLRSGGGALIYSDSASGGHYGTVGAHNPVGQTVTNNLISQYGMEVLVDQAAGTTAYRPFPGATHPIVSDRPVLEGEGVSPVAVDPNGGAVTLIPYTNDPENKVSGKASLKKLGGLTITNPEFAALALAEVGSGNFMAMFDRQPIWNDGPGSDIDKRDNREILRRIINYLVENSQTSSLSTEVAGNLQVSTAGYATLFVEVSDPLATLNWSKHTGPGTVTFSDVSGYQTTATFSDPGLYELMLTASHGAITVTSSHLVEAVSPENVTYAINSGIGSLSSTTGFSYQQDSNFQGGWIDNMNSPIVNTADDQLYYTARSGQTSYNLPLENGIYTLLLQFNETYFLAENKRVFDVTIEGELALNHLDLFKTVGSKNKAFDTLFEVEVTDGSLDIGFEASKNNSILSALVVTKVSPENAGIAVPGRI